MAAADSRCALAFSLSPGQAGDAPAGRALLHALPPLPARCHLVMDRAYEGNETRQLALDLGLDPVVPAASAAGPAMGVQHRDLQAPQRNRAPVAPSERVPPHLQPLRQARRHVRGLHPLRTDRRIVAIVLTGPRATLIQ
ncbi:MAG: transposase [Tepidimonas ignava]|uniref:transposase n=1 Tax=Tepidimonas ignava TaxID=114249 RepID=UPI00391E0263